MLGTNIFELISIHRYYYFFLTLTISLFSSPSLSNYLSDCYTNESEYSINASCRGLSSLKGLQSNFSENKLIYLSLSKTNDKNISNPKLETNKNLHSLKLIGKGWKYEDLEIFSTAFPNLFQLICEYCSLRDFGFLDNWDNLKKLYIDEFRIKDGLSNVMARIENYQTPYSFENLKYEKISEIRVNPSPNTNFTCETLGLWARKIQFFTGNYPSNYPLPYRDMRACFSSINNLTSVIIQGDELYKNKDMKGAHKLYREALEINPWDLKAISSYMLTSYHLKEYCNGIDVGSFGSKQANGSKSTIASVNYNLHLIYHAVGDTINAKKYLLESNKIKPSKSKERKLSLIDTTRSAEYKCKENEKWLASHRNSIDEKALSRDRNLPKKKPTNNLNFTSYQVIATHQGKKKVDTYYASWPSISLSPGYYGVIIHSDKPLDFWLGKGDLQCVYPKNIGLTTYIYQYLTGRLIEASKKPYHNQSIPEGKTAYLIDIQKNDSFESTGELRCEIYGEHWNFNTDNFTFNLVRFEK